MDEKVVINTSDFLPGELRVDDAEAGVSDEEMPEAAEAMPEDDAAVEMPEGETTPPKGYVPQKDLDKLRSTYDRQLSEERRRADLTQRQLDALMAQQEKTELELLDIRTRDMTEDEAKLERKSYEISKRERELETKQRQAEISRTLALKEEYAVKLSTQYGVPKQVLLDAQTTGPQHMEEIAKAYQQGRRTSAGQQRKEAGTDNLGAGVASRTGLGSFRDVERAYAGGRISEAQYAAARRKAGIDD